MCFPFLIFGFLCVFFDTADDVDPLSFRSFSCSEGAKARMWRTEVVDKDIVIHFILHTKILLKS